MGIQFLGDVLLCCRVMCCYVAGQVAPDVLQGTSTALLR